MTTNQTYRPPTPSEVKAASWWGMCGTYLDALEYSREFIADGLLVEGMEECREHERQWVVYAEKEAWWTGFVPHHIK